LIGLDEIEMGCQGGGEMNGGGKKFGGSGMEMI